MVHKIFSIRDAKAEVYKYQFSQKTVGEAERYFKGLFDKAYPQNDPMLVRFPEDYDLYYLGEFDDVTGKLKSLDTPQHIMKAVEKQAEVTA